MRQASVNSLPDTGRASLDAGIDSAVEQAVFHCWSWFPPSSSNVAR